MNDKTEQSLTDVLRLTAKSAEPWSAAMIGASHLNEAADTIDTLRADLDRAIVNFGDAAATVCDMRAQLAEAQAALKTVMRNAELSKEPCGPDHESPAAIRNGKFADLASIAAQGLGMVRGPSLTEHLVEAQRDTERLDWLGNQFVTVRVPLRYGSKECFKDSPTDNDGEFIPWNIRAAIDAAKGESNA